MAMNYIKKVEVIKEMGTLDRNDERFKAVLVRDTKEDLHTLIFQGIFAYVHYDEGDSFGLDYMFTFDDGELAVSDVYNFKKAKASLINNHEA